MSNSRLVAKDALSFSIPERTPSAKILKAPLRDLVREAWKVRVARGGSRGGAKL